MRGSYGTSQQTLLPSLSCSRYENHMCTSGHAHSKLTGQYSSHGTVHALDCTGLRGVTRSEEQGRGEGGGRHEYSKIVFLDMHWVSNTEVHFRVWLHMPSNRCGVFLFVDGGVLCPESGCRDGHSWFPASHRGDQRKHSMAERLQERIVQ